MEAILRYLEAVDLILRYDSVDINCCDFGGNGILSLAVTNGSLAIVERLLRFGSVNSTTNPRTELRLFFMR